MTILVWGGDNSKKENRLSRLATRALASLAADSTDEKILTVPIPVTFSSLGKPDKLTKDLEKM